MPKIIDHEARMQLYNQGLTDEEIAEQIGVSRVTISNWRRKYNLPVNRKKKHYTPTPYERRLVCGTIFRLIKKEGI